MARRRLFVERHDRFSGDSEINRVRDSWNLVRSLSAMMPFPSMSSLLPWQGLMTTGRAQAMASRTALGMPSFLDGNMNTSADW